ncbi:hypothetical protein GCM10027190_06940 [Spirosoma areae]
MRPDGEVTERIEAFIRDENGKPVANPQIRVNVNGKALALNNGSSNYYGAYPHYQLTDPSLPVSPDAPYAVTVVLTDGQAYRLGTIQTQPAITPARFSPPAKHARQQPLTLNWLDLEPHNWLVSRWKSWQGETSVTTLNLAKSNRTTDEWNNVHYDGSSPDQADYLTTAVGSGQGDYTVPVSYFQGPMNPFNTLEVLIASEKSVKVNKPFLDGSALSSSRTSMYRIEVTNGLTKR